MPGSAANSRQVELDSAGARPRYADNHPVLLLVVSKHEIEMFDVTVDKPCLASAARSGFAGALHDMSVSP